MYWSSSANGYSPLGHLDNFAVRIEDCGERLDQIYLNLYDGQDGRVESGTVDT